MEAERTDVKSDDEKGGDEKVDRVEEAKSDDAPRGQADQVVPEVAREFKKVMAMNFSALQTWLAARGVR